MNVPIEALLFGLLLVTAITVARLRDLFAAAMMTGIFSLLSAGVFTLMDAVDVAFTEAAVGAGISTVLMLGALSLTGSREYQGPPRLLPFVVVLITGAVLVYGTLDMPHYGDPLAPIHRHVAPDYIAGSDKLEIPNVVTTVLASYRGYDTFGETTVVFAAVVGVLLMLVVRRRETDAGDDGATAEGDDLDVPSTFDGETHMRMVDKIILRVIGKALVPFFFLFALYVQFHGDFGPGGGFQAGVIFAAGFVLYGLIFGLEAVKRVAPKPILEIGAAVGVLIWGGVGVVALLRGGNFLEYDVLSSHGQHLGIMLVEAGVLCTVTCGLTLIFYLFAGRGSA